MSLLVWILFIKNFMQAYTQSLKYMQEIIPMWFASMFNAIKTILMKVVLVLCHNPVTKIFQQKQCHFSFFTWLNPASETAEKYLVLAFEQQNVFLFFFQLF